MDAFKRILSHPAGPKTIFFWAPTFKWMISISNVSDFKRPVEQISYPQQIAVTATGLIWSRYSMVINPVNYNLFAVNVFMAITGLYQLYRKTLQAPPSADLPPGAGLAAAGAANSLFQLNKDARLPA